MCVVIFTHALNDDHGGHRGNSVWVLAQWWHPVTLREAVDALHWAMWLMPYPSGGMIVEITGKFATFVYIVDNRVAKY